MKIHKEGYTTILIMMAFIGFINYLNFNFITLLIVQVVQSIEIFCGTYPTLLVYFSTEPSIFL